MVKTERNVSSSSSGAKYSGRLKSITFPKAKAASPNFIHCLRCGIERSRPTRPSVASDSVGSYPILRSNLTTSAKETSAWLNRTATDRFGKSTRDVRMPAFNRGRCSSNQMHELQWICGMLNVMKVCVSSWYSTSLRITDSSVR